MSRELMKMMPDLEIEEMEDVRALTAGFTPEEMEYFVSIYRRKRKSPETILILTALGFVAVAGLQRLVTNQIGMGILYILTGGLCLIGTIVDCINYKKLTYEYNRKVALQTVHLIEEGY